MTTSVLVPHPAAVLRAIVADDEPLARRALLRLLAHAPDVEVVGEAEDVPSLAALLQRFADAPPELLFLDVHMPGGSGFDIVHRLAPRTRIVFTTAHAEHAAQAFDVDAVDFLRKPFGAPRLQQALDRARRHLPPPRRSAPHGPSADTTEDGHASITPEASSTLLVRVGAREIPVPLASIWRFEGADDCVRLVTAERTLVHTATLQSLQALPYTAGFLRVHRRHLVNTRAIAAVVPHDERRAAIQFPDGSRVVCSRPGSVALRRWVRARRGTSVLGEH